MLDEITFRQLLHESEGTRLDFKAEQYRFDHADEAEKSKLLKDVLALANSWRSETAYIIIGVSDGEPASRHVIGIVESDHIDDAHLQQFINSKLNRALTFSYRSFRYDENTYGVYEIPVQERPFYAKKDFGRVKQGVVYYRQGSSCAEASPEDIAMMGRDDTARRTSHPRLIVHFVDVETRERIGEEQPLAVISHAPHDPREIPDHRDPPRTRQVSPNFAVYLPETLTGRSAREDYWRELADYLRDRRRFAPILLGIHNPSGVMASNVHVEVRIPAQDCEAREVDDVPEMPDSHFDLLRVGIRPLSTPYSQRPDDLTVRRRGNEWLLVAEFEGVRPRQTVTVALPIYVAPAASGTIELYASCYAAQLPEPSRTTLRLQSLVEARQPLTIDDLEQFRFEDSQRQLRQRGLLKDEEPEEED